MADKRVCSGEHWTKWNPTNLPEGQYIVTGLTQDSSGVKIALDDEKTFAEVYFDGIPAVIRVTPEGLRMRTWAEVQAKQRDVGFFRNWFLYKVEHSTLCKWIAEESCGYQVGEPCRHYCIVTCEELIDIVASFEPTISASLGDRSNTPNQDATSAKVK